MARQENIVNMEPTRSHATEGDDDMSLTSSTQSGSSNMQEKMIGTEERVPDTQDSPAVSVTRSMAEDSVKSSGTKDTGEPKEVSSKSGNSAENNVLNPLKFGSYSDWEKAQGMRKDDSMGKWENL